jgi:thymidylate synthase ThyX
MEKVLTEVRAVSPELADKISPELLREVKVSPTLVKYAEPNKYEMESRKELAQAATELMKNATIEKVPPVILISGTKAEGDALEIEIAANLLYAHCHYPYVQVRKAVEALSTEQRAELVALGTKHRGKHDELPRAFCAGQRFRFDILMDVGGFRDMHRHRRCVQVMQAYTTAHGYDVPADVIEAGEETRYHLTMKRAEEVMANLGAIKEGVVEAAENAQYLLPLAYRRRCLFSMDLAEAVYISELRTTPAGHWSYREVAYAMYEEVVKRHPGLKHLFRVTDVREPVDLLKR